MSGVRRHLADKLANKLGLSLASCHMWGAGKTGARLLKHPKRVGVDIAAVIEIDPRKIGGIKRGVPVLARDALPRPRGAFVITAVGAIGACALIRQHLSKKGYTESLDFICAA